MGSIRTATAPTCDVDGDGFEDLILVGADRRVARNASVRDDVAWLTVELGRALGTVVRAHHASGRVAIQRYGSSLSVGDSQVVTPLRFASPASDPIVEVEARWPGGASSRREVDGETRLELVR